FIPLRHKSWLDRRLAGVIFLYSVSPFGAVMQDPYDYDGYTVTDPDAAMAEWSASIKAEQARTDLAFDDELMHYTSRRLSEGASSEEITAEIERFKELASTGMTMDEILGLADH